MCFVFLYGFIIFLALGAQSQEDSNSDAQELRSQPEMTDIRKSQVVGKRAPVPVKLGYQNSNSEFLIYSHFCDPVPR